MHLSPGSRTFSSSTQLARKLDALRPPPRPLFRVVHKPVEILSDDEKRARKILLCDKYGAIRAVFHKIRWLTLEKALAALMPPPAVPTEKRWMARKIIEEIAYKHGLSADDLICDGRIKPLVIARHEACYEIARLTHLSLPQIGRALGNRDHTTILSAIRRHIERTGAPSVRGLGPTHARGT